LTLYIGGTGCPQARAPAGRRRKGDTTMRLTTALGELIALAAFIAAIVGWLSILA